MRAFCSEDAWMIRSRLYMTARTASELTSYGHWYTTQNWGLDLLYGLNTRRLVNRTYDLIGMNFLHGLGLNPTVVSGSYQSKSSGLREVVTWPYDVEEDRSTFGNLFSNVQLAFHIKSGVKTPRNERNCSHINLEGDAYGDNTIPYVSFADGTIRNYDIPCRIGTIEGSPLYYDTTGTPTTGSRPAWSFTADDLGVILQRIKDYLDDNPYYVASYTLDSRVSNVAVKNFEFEISDSSVTIRYTQDIKLQPSLYTVSRFSTVLRLELYSTPKFGTFNLYSTGQWSIGKMSIEDTISFRYTTYNYTPPYSGWGEDNNLTFETELVTALERNFAVTPDHFVPDTVIHVCNEWADEIRQSIQHEWSHLFPSAYMSTNDALTDWQTVLDSNFIESLSEIDAAWDTMRAPKEMLESITKLFQYGKWSLFTGVLNFVDILADTTLLVKFGLEPIASDLYTIGTMLDDAIAAYEKKASRLELRGKFTFTAFPEDSILSGCTLVTRTKLRLIVPRESLVAALLPSTVVGIDPSVKNFWAATRFSWLVDIFTNMSKRIDYGETYLRFMSCQIALAVHSFTLYYPLPETSYQSPELGVTIELDGQRQLKFYERRVSQILPAPRFGKYDFFTVTKPPPIDTVGSFLWQLL